MAVDTTWMSDDASRFSSPDLPQMNEDDDNDDDIAMPYRPMHHRIPSANMKKTKVALPRIRFQDPERPARRVPNRQLTAGTRRRDRDMTQK